MKKILAIIALTLTVTACSGETTPKVTDVVVPPQPAVKVPDEIEDSTTPKTKKACIKVWDAKLNKEVEKCKVIKIHKKYDGTTVPK